VFPLRARGSTGSDRIAVSPQAICDRERWQYCTSLASSAQAIEANDRFGSVMDVVDGGSESRRRFTSNSLNSAWA